MPDAENPAPKKSEESERPTVPTDISTSEYHQRADAWLEELFHRLEEQQSDRPDLEVDYSVRAFFLSASLQRRAPRILVYFSLLFDC